jgi:nicotinamidase-related amidase
VANPYLLDRDESVLCVLDIQERLAGRMAERDKVVANARMLILAARRLEIPILVTEHCPKIFGLTVPELAAVLDKSNAPVDKSYFGCADEPEFMDRLKSAKRKQVLMCGLETHICILQTCLQLLDRNYRIHVAADAVSSRHGEHKALSLDQMRQSGAIITCAEAAVFQFAGRAGTPEFKDLLNLIK